MNPLSSAFTNIRRSPFQSLTAIVITTMTLFVAYFFSLIILGTQQILNYFETRPQVIGFFELDASTSEINQVGQQVQQKSYVNDIKLITQEEALSVYRMENKDDPLLLELVTADILPASIEVSADEISSLVQIKNDLETLDEIEEVVFQQDIVDSLTNWTTSLRYIGIAAVMVLGLTSFLIITALVSMKVTQRKNAIQIMKFLGASSWFIKAPFFFEGVIYGLVGSLVGWGIMFVALLYLTPWLKNFLGTISLLPVPWEIFAIQLSTGTLIAILLGGFSGMTAVKRMMK
ncbi:permease-like cell division protein FtsX [Patescibacteria group bacterium]|nr:permease-like cell division protein FtsX [Patescibacteria group bacterium]MBU1885240.1 permease-like cell division protein FtsX [Patescibacteria group bacterium]